MRGSSYHIISLILVWLFAPHNAHAAGNVLLPSDTSSSSNPSSSLPNLGISPPAPVQNAPAPVQTTPSPVASPPPAPQFATTPPAPPVMASQTPQLPSTPAMPKMSDIISPVDPVTAAKLPRGVIPTQVIHQPDGSAFFALANQDLPYTLTASIGPKSIFGAKDVDIIHTKLGLSPNQIPSNCILTLRGIMQTDKGSYILNGPPSPQVSLHYDGIIKRYMLAAQALCTADNLPPGSGFLTEIGNRYNISLQPINCSPPNRQISQLVVTYDGSGTSQCAYQ